MAIAFRTSSNKTDVHTVSETWTSTIPAAVVTDDVMTLVWSQVDNAVGTISDNGGGSAWTKVNASASGEGSIWLKRAVSGSASATMTFSKHGMYAFCAHSGCLTSGTPYEANSIEENVAGNESHASITSLGASRWLVFGVANIASAYACSSEAATDPSTISERADANNGTIARGAMVASASQSAQGACGTITWNQTNDSTVSLALYLIPETQSVVPVLLRQYRQRW